MKYLCALLIVTFSCVLDASEFRLATFSADITIPLNHRCMGVLPTKSKRIADPLLAHGFVLSDGKQTVVLCALDWCEVRNGAFDQWREALAKAAGTVRENVLVTALHQHDAPVIDRDAAKILAAVGLPDELYHVTWHDKHWLEYLKPYKIAWTWPPPSLILESAKRQSCELHPTAVLYWKTERLPTAEVAAAVATNISPPLQRATLIRC